MLELLTTKQAAYASRCPQVTWPPSLNSMAMSIRYRARQTCIPLGPVRFLGFVAGKIFTWNDRLIYTVIE